MAVIKRIHGGNLREASEKYGLSEDRLLDFSANINPLGPSPRAMEAIAANMGAVVNYPDPEARHLREAVSEETGLPIEMIMAGNGAIEIIYLLMKVLKPGRALIPAPTFNEYELAVVTGGGAVKDLLLQEGKDFAIDKDDIFAEWHDTDLVFICNPNNPTGCLTPRSDMEAIIAEAHRLGKTVVVDEAFMDFLCDRENYSVVDLVPHYSNLFVLYSLTKFYAIPGLRLGMGLGSRDVIEKLNSVRDPWNVNCFAQLAGLASLKDAEYRKAALEYVETQREYMHNGLSQVDGLRVYKPSANYVFVDVAGTGYSSTELLSEMGQQGILIRDCSSYKNLRPVYIRVAVKKRHENDRLLEALLQLRRK